LRFIRYYSPKSGKAKTETGSENFCEKWAKFLRKKLLPVANQTAITKSTSNLDKFGANHLTAEQSRISFLSGLAKTGLILPLIKLEVKGQIKKEMYFYSKLVQAKTRRDKLENFTQILSGIGLISSYRFSVRSLRWFVCQHSCSCYHCCLYHEGSRHHRPGHHCRPGYNGSSYNGSLHHCPGNHRRRANPSQNYHCRRCDYDGGGRWN
jgi:hypothetical protein